MLYSAVLTKVAFWMLLIGVVALLTPNPAWPPAVAYAVIGAGVILLIGLFVHSALSGRPGGRPGDR